MRLELQATAEEVVRAVEALERFANAQGVPEKAIFGLALALEECASNIVNHAYQRDARRVFQVCFERRGDVFIIELRDRGPEFDPTKAPSRQRPALEDDEPGGWGIQLTRHYVDEIRYRREAGENILRLHKRLDLSASKE